jgi:hypothetical protein
MPADRAGVRGLVRAVATPAVWGALLAGVAAAVGGVVPFDERRPLPHPPPLPADCLHVARLSAAQQEAEAEDSGTTEESELQNEPTSSHPYVLRFLSGSPPLSLPNQKTEPDPTDASAHLVSEIPSPRLTGPCSTRHPLAILPDPQL